MFNNLHIAGVNYDSVVDGCGMRTAIYFSGCTHRCPGCHNPETHDPNYGRLADANVAQTIAAEINRRPYIRGITLTGGDPYFNPCVHNFVIRILKQVNRHINVWAYTGAYYHEVENKPLTDLVDVLVDGPYIESLRDPSLAFRGSSNQRIIDVQASRKAGKVILYTPKGERYDRCILSQP